MWGERLNCWKLWNTSNKQNVTKCSVCTVIKERTFTLPERFIPCAPQKMTNDYNISFLKENHITFVCLNSCRLYAEEHLWNKFLFSTPKVLERHGQSTCNTDNLCVRSKKEDEKMDQSFNLYVLHILNIEQNAFCLKVSDHIKWEMLLVTKMCHIKSI